MGNGKQSDHPPSFPQANRVHERERDALSARASAAEERVGDLEKRLAALQSDSSELARARAEAEGDLDAARAAQRKLESAHEELARECEALGRELGSAREREGRLTKEVQEARREAAELRARLEVAEAGKGAAEARGEAERGRLVAEVTRLTEEVRRLSGLADEEARRADRAEGERRELAETKERLKQALQEASGELVVVGEQLAQVSGSGRGGGHLGAIRQQSGDGQRGRVARHCSCPLG